MVLFGIGDWGEILVIIFVECIDIVGEEIFIWLMLCVWRVVVD